MRMLLALLAAVLALTLTPVRASTPSGTNGHQGSGTLVLPYGTKAQFHQHHAVFPDGRIDNRSGWVYSFPVKAAPITRVVKSRVKSPIKRTHRNVPHSRQKSARRAPAPVYRPSGRFTASMLVTYYLATGNPMANGIYPSVGWAACGYDLALGTRVYVPGIGTLTCGDRIGYDPWRHIDVFGIPLGTGYRMVTVY